MSNNPPYPPPGGEPPYGPPGQGQPPGQGPPPGGYPQGGYPPANPQGGYPQGPPPGYGQQPPPPGYGQQPPPAYGPPGQPSYGAPYAQGGYGVPPAPPSKRWYQRWWVWVVAVLGVLIIAGVILGQVFGSKQYQLESKIKDVLKDQNLSVSDVHCPSSIDTDEGNRYTCTAVIDGTQHDLSVVFVSDRNFTVTEQQ